MWYIRGYWLNFDCKTHANMYGINISAYHIFKVCYHGPPENGYLGNP